MSGIDLQQRQRRIRRENRVSYLTRGNSSKPSLILKTTGSASTWMSLQMKHNVKQELATSVRWTLCLRLPVGFVSQESVCLLLSAHLLLLQTGAGAQLANAAWYV
jgi:hypothetical protein